jgi:hypothetical protein
MKSFILSSDVIADIEKLDHCHSLELNVFNIGTYTFYNFHLKELILIDNLHSFVLV